MIKHFEMNDTFLEMWFDDRLTWQIYIGKVVKNKTVSKSEKA